MQIQTKKGRLQQWSMLHKQNKKLENDGQLKGFEMKKDTRSYLISIKGVSGVPTQEVNSSASLMPMQGAKYYMEYYMTLFNKEMGVHGGFYGRTYRSQPVALKDAGGTWNHNTKDYVYFHTNYIEKTSCLVVECVIVRDIAGLKSYSSAGYAICDIF